MQRRPGLERAGRDRRLGEVVDDEPDVRQAAGDGQRRRQLARPDEQVVGEARPAPTAAMPATDVVAAQPVRIGLVVDLVADPDEAVAAGPAAERGDRVGDAGSVRSTQPTTPRTNGVSPATARKSRVSSRLDRVWTRTVASTPAAAQVRLEVGRPERAGGSRRARRSATGSRPSPGPRSGGGRRRSRLSPRRRRGVGPDQALGAEVVPQVGRDRPRAASAGYSSRWATRPDAGDERGDRGVGERELDGRRPERDVVAGADLADPPGPLDDLGRRRRVVEAAPGARVGEHAAVHHAADEHARRRARRTAAAARRARPGRAACSGRRGGTTSMSVSRAKRASISDWFMPAPIGPDHALARGAAPAPGTPRRSPPASGRPGRG